MRFVSPGSPRRLQAGPFLVSERFYRARTISASHVHSASTVFVTLEGSFTEIVEDRSWSFHPGTAILMGPGVVHRDAFGDGAVRGLLISIQLPTSAALRRFLENGDSSVVTFDAGSDLPVRLHSEFRGEDPCSRTALEGLVLELIARGLRAHIAGESSDRWVRARRFLERNYRKPIGGADVAREIGGDPAEIARSFREFHGRSIAAYIRSCRLRYAAERLVFSSASLRQIAEEAGFYDQAEFSREFKWAFGRAPLRHRKAAGEVTFLNG